MTCTIVSSGSEQYWRCKNEHEYPYTAIKVILLQKIRQLYTDGFTKFYMNCEFGVPLWAAEVICLLKEQGCMDLQLCIVIPYEEQCRNWSEDLRNRYYRVHELADNVILTSTQYHEKCYQYTDEIMAKESDLIMIFKQSEEDVYILKYAEKFEIPIAVLKMTD